MFQARYQASFFNHSHVGTLHFLKFSSVAADSDCSDFQNVHIFFISKLKIAEIIFKDYSSDNNIMPF